MTEEIEELPAGWDYRRIGDALKLLNGYAFKSIDWSRSGRPIVRIQNLKSESAAYNHYDGDLPERFKVKPGDLLFAWSGTPGTSFGAHIWKGSEAWVNQHIFKVDFSPTDFDRDFLKLALNRNLVEYIGQAQGGVGLAHITKTKLNESLLVHPPLDIQRRIARAVAEHQVLRASILDQLSVAQQSVERIRRATLAAACSGRLTEDWRSSHLGSPDAEEVLVNTSIARNQNKRVDNISGDLKLPSGWTRATVEDLAAPGTAVSYGIVKPGPEVPGGVPYVRQQDVVGGTVLVDQLAHTSTELAAKHRRSELQEGDVLLCIIRNLRVAIVPSGIDGANITQGMVRIRPGARVMGKYLAYYLAAPSAQRRMRDQYVGLAMPRINVRDARSLVIDVPPLDEQREIVNRISQLFSLADKLEQRIDRAVRQVERTTQATLAKAFRGDLAPTAE